MDRVQAWGAASFVAWVVLFLVVERVLPGRARVDRRRELPLDVLAFVVVTIGAALSQGALLALGKKIGLSAPTAFRDAPLHPALRVAIVLVLVDLGIYAVHRAMHAYDVLWPTHRWHHSVEDLYWFSGFRTSVAHAFLYAVPQVIFPVFVLPLGPMELLAWGMVGGFFQLYIHSSIDVGLGPAGWLVVTPRYHRLHHARTSLRAANLGTYLTIWDRLFGTFVDPDAVPAPGALGIDEKVGKARMIVGF